MRENAEGTPQVRVRRKKERGSQMGGRREKTSWERVLRNAVADRNQVGREKNGGRRSTESETSEPEFIRFSVQTTDIIKGKDRKVGQERRESASPQRKNNVGLLARQTTTRGREEPAQR